MSVGSKVFLALILLPAVTLAAAVEVPQGAVARWNGDALSCGMDGRTWKAHQGDCYFPIDFKRAPGTFEIARWPAAGSMESAWLKVVERDFGEQDIEFPDDTFVNLSPENLERHYGEQAEVKPVFRRRTPAVFELPLEKPADPLPEGGGFGARRTFNGEGKNAHTGTDYAITTGTPVVSVAKGTVVLVGDHFFSGKSVFVDHGDGLISMYFHLDDFQVEAGNEVEAGQTLATVGSTGRSTGPHLHLGLRWRGARIEPDPLLGSLVVVDVP